MQIDPDPGYTVFMDRFYSTKAALLLKLQSHLDAALHACGELEKHEATAPAGEEGFMFSTFATLSDLHAGVADEVDAVRAMVQLSRGSSVKPAAK